MNWKTLGIAAASLSLLSLGTACSDDSGAGGSGASGSTTTTTSGSGGSGGGGGGGNGYTFTTVDGFNLPESCHWDATNQVWYVSNIAPPPSEDITEKDGVGWISRLDKDGMVMDAQWIKDLDSPAGLRLYNGILYVANIDNVLGFNVADGSLAETYQFPAAVLLNDPAVDEATGNVYVSDTFGNIIYTFQAGMVGIGDTFVDSPDLMGPNGLLVDGGNLIVASLVDFSPDTQGPLLTIPLGNGMIYPFGNLTGKLDGIEKDGDSYFVSENSKAQIYRVAADGTPTLLFDLMTDQGLMSVADIGYDPARKMLCLPDIAGNTVSFLTMN